MKLAFLALLSAATATVLTVSERQFTFRDFAGTFTSAFRTSTCPRKIFHKGVKEPGGNAILHGVMKANNVTCDDNGELQLFPLSNGNRVSMALGGYSGGALQLANTLVENARKTRDPYMGLSDTPRICGAFTLERRSIVLFVKSDKNFSPSTGVELSPNQRIMVFVRNRPNNPVICPYTAKLRVLPSPKPQPTAPKPGTTVPTKPPVPTTSPSAAPSPSVSPASNDGGSVCFPASSTVITDRGVIHMNELRLGDNVRVSNGKFSPVFMFTHRLRHTQHHFVHITAASGATIALTPSHYLVVNGALRAASAVVIGDTLTLADGTSSAVVSINMEKGVGLYNPQTIEGSIIVDGILASTYTSAIEPRAAHSLLAPMRAAYGWLGVATAAFDAGADSIASLLPKGVVSY